MQTSQPAKSHFKEVSRSAPTPGQGYDISPQNMKTTGSVVLCDCFGNSATICKLCTQGTFMSEPSGLHECFTCRNCVENQGLNIQSKCITISDTICDVLDGYHCTHFSDSQCIRAQKHSVCAPGQETKTPGTKSSDTVCVNCPHGFYSPSGLNCIKWTDCTARNEIQTENGSSVKDVTCTPKIRERYCLIFAVVLNSPFYIILLLISLSTNYKLKYPVEEWSKYNTTHMQHTEENQ